MAVATTTAALIGGGLAAGSAAYSANRQRSAARDATAAQAEGVRNAQDVSQRNANLGVEALRGGYGQAQDAIRSGGQNVMQLLSGGHTAANDALTSGYGDAINTMQPTASQGGQASELQAALSGALGPAAQQEAFSNYTASPGQDFLRDQQEQALLRNEAALGGGLSPSGRVMTALQDQAFQRAQTDFGNQFGRLGQIASRGDAASGMISQLQAALGGNRSNLETSSANNMANAQGNTASQIAQLLAGQGTAEANVRTGQGAQQAQLSQNLGQANSSYDIYRSQNTSPLLQGVNAGVGAFTGMGGMAGLLGGSSPPPNAGSRIQDYRGPQMQNWLAGR